jgi:hypothetical protein
MSLFCSLKLIKDVKSSLTPTTISEKKAAEVTSHIKFYSPKQLTEDPKFVFKPMINRLVTLESREN